MKKNFSKTIMIIVAVLLTLVLISTSTVSGIFAKYVVTKSATTEVSLKKFGIKLIMEQGGTDFTNSGAHIVGELKNDTISVTIDGISLKPGDNYPEIIRFKAEDADSAKNFTVNTRIKVKAVVNTTDDEQGANFTHDSTFFIPIVTKIKINNGDAKVIADARSTYTDFSAYQTELNDNLRKEIGTNVDNGDSEWAGYKIATAGSADFDSTAKKTIAFGFACPDTYGGTDSEKFDKIMTQIAENEAKLSITFYVSLEQIV